MHGVDTKKIVQEHFRKLLREELARGGHGAGAAITESTGIKSSHISNMISSPPTRNPGLETMHALARHWGKGYAQLEAEALGQTALSHGSKLHPALAAFVASHPSADPAIVDLLRVEPIELHDVELDVEFFRESYERIRRARDDARRLARAGAFAQSDDGPVRASAGALSAAAAAINERARGPSRRRRNA